MSLLEDPACPRTVVNLTFTECLGRLHVALSSCPGLEEGPPVSCVEIEVSDIRNQSGGSGTYYDASGTAFEMGVNEVDMSLDDLSSQRIRTGVLRGTTLAGDAGTCAVELSFSACAQPLRVCLR